MNLYRHRPYGLALPVQVDRRSLEWICYMYDHRPENGGLGAAGHFKEGFKRTWPSVEVQKEMPDGTIIRNHWFDRMINAFCSNEHAKKHANTTFRSIVLSGCGAAGKTFTAGAFITAWWNCSPGNSIAVITSTTREMVRRRIWPIISKFQTSMVGQNGQAIKQGHLVDSRMEIVYEDPNTKTKDSKHAIFAMAVAHGETQKAVHNLKGMHAERMLLVIDEANGTPDAIFSVITNWRKACSDMTVIIIGNPLSKLDNHGVAMEPEDGWAEHDNFAFEWRTKRIAEWDLDGGICLRFDGSDSPNVKAGKTIFPYIFTNEDWENAKDNGENTLAYWTQSRGLHPPEGMLEAVLNEQALTNARINDQLHFIGPKTLVSSLDPAFGGDAAKYKVGYCGQIEGGNIGLQIIDTVEFTIMVGEEGEYDEADLQVARQFVAANKSRGIAPINSAVEATGTGRGVYAFVCSLWSAEVMRFDASNRPSQQPVLEGDRRPADEVYRDRVTESWVRVGSLVRTEQLKGLNKQSQIEFTQRKLITPDNSRNKTKLEGKDKFKVRLGHSPDDADADAVLADLCAMRLGLVVDNPRRGGEVQSDGAAWSELERKWALPYADSDEAQIPEVDFIFS